MVNNKDRIQSPWPSFLRHVCGREAGGGLRGLAVPPLRRGADLGGEAHGPREEPRLRHEAAGERERKTMAIFRRFLVSIGSTELPWWCFLELIASFAMPICPCPVFRSDNDFFFKKNMLPFKDVYCALSNAFLGLVRNVSIYTSRSRSAMEAAGPPSSAS